MEGDGTVCGHSSRKMVADANSFCPLSRCTVTHLSSLLQRKVRGYYNFIWERCSAFQGNSITNELPMILQIQVRPA